MLGLRIGELREQTFQAFSDAWAARCKGRPNKSEEQSIVSETSKFIDILLVQRARLKNQARVYRHRKQKSDEAVSERPKSDDAVSESNKGGQAAAETQEPKTSPDIKTLLMRPKTCDWDFEKQHAYKTEGDMVTTTRDVFPENKKMGDSSPVIARFSDQEELKVASIWWGIVHPASSKEGVFRPLGQKQKAKKGLFQKGQRAKERHRPRREL